MESTGERFIPEMLEETNETYQEHIERYKFASKYVKDLVVLDAACGVGFGSYMLSKVAKQVFGIDISYESIEYAKSKYDNKNIRFEVIDVKEIKYPDSFFDAVVSFETIEHISSPEIFLREVKRILKPNGLLIISTPNRETAPDGKPVHVPFHIQEFTLQEISTLLNKFKNISVYSQKMTYHKRSYKKIRLASRYLNKNVRNKIVSLWGGKIFEENRIPVFIKILTYEYFYKARVFPYIENNKYIKPTFFIMTCRN